jgi:hypothetical protein
MDFDFDLATNTLTPSDGATEISLKWRSREPVRIRFLRADTAELLPVGHGLALYLAKDGDVLAECVSLSIPGAATGWYEGTLILHTTPLTEAFDEETITSITAEIELHWWASGQASTPAISDNIVPAQISRPRVEPEPAAVEVLSGGEEWLEARAPRWIPAITGLTGGGATKLDGLVTDGKSDLLVILHISSELQDWLLVAGTDAEDAANGLVRPDDYAASTNEQVWKRKR